MNSHAEFLLVLAESVSSLDPSSLAFYVINMYQQRRVLDFDVFSRGSTMLRNGADVSARFSEIKFSLNSENQRNVFKAPSRTEPCTQRELYTVLIAALDIGAQFSFPAVPETHNARCEYVDLVFNELESIFDDPEHLHVAVKDCFHLIFIMAMEKGWYILPMCQLDLHFFASFKHKMGPYANLARFNLLPSQRNKPVKPTAPSALQQYEPVSAAAGAKASSEIKSDAFEHFTSFEKLPGCHGSCWRWLKGECKSSSGAEGHREHVCPVCGAAHRLADDSACMASFVKGTSKALQGKLRKMLSRPLKQGQ